MQVILVEAHITNRTFMWIRRRSKECPESQRRSKIIFNTKAIIKYKSSVMKLNGAGW